MIKLVSKNLPILFATKITYIVKSLIKVPIKISNFFLFESHQSHENIVYFHQRKSFSLNILFLLIYVSLAYVNIII